MSAPTHTQDEARERAALYALGTLSADDARAFEEHLTSGCDVCRAEVRGCAAVAADLGRAASPQPPRPSLRARMLERIAADSPSAHQAILELDGLLFVRTPQVPWQPGRGPAIESKTLFRDAQRGYRTQLIRMHPGARYPAHRHADVEELYLIEGDLLVRGVLMRAGDYCRAEAGSVHSDVSTQGGCVFIATASERNELLS